MWGSMVAMPFVKQLTFEYFLHVNLFSSTPTAGSLHIIPAAT